MGNKEKLKIAQKSGRKSKVMQKKTQKQEESWGRVAAKW